MRRLLKVAARSVVASARREPPALPPVGARIAERVPGVAAYTIRRYLRTVDADGEAFPEGAVPALLPSIWEPRLIMGLLAGDGVRLPLGPIIHSASERTLLRRLGPDRAYRVELTVAESSWEADGGRLAIVSRVRDEPGRVCTEGWLRLRLPRGERRGGVRPADGESVPWSRVAEGTVTLSHARRYARLSGDWNPIHISRITAAPFGFRRPILHGGALEGWVACRLGRRVALRQLEIRFRRPVLLPDRLRLERTGGGRFRVRSDRTDTVLADGIAHPTDGG